MLAVFKATFCGIRGFVIETLNQNCMKKCISTIAVCLAVLALSVGCEKESEYAEVKKDPWQPGTNVLQSFFANNVDNATQNFTIDPTQFQTIVGANGMVISIFANSLMDATGTLVVGPVDVSLIEVPTKGDMIWLDKTTTSNGALLISGGEFRIGLEHKGQPVKTAPGLGLGIALANPLTRSMDAFTGTITEDGGVNWILTDSNAFNPVGGVDTTFGSPNATLPIDGVDWINCDYFANGDSNTVVTILADDSIGQNNARFFFYFEDEEAVAPAIGVESCTCFKSYDTGLPMGKRIRVIGIAELDGEKYFYSSDLFNIVPDQEVNATLLISNEIAIKTALDNL